MVKQNASLGNKNEHSGLKLDAKDLENIRNGISLYERLNPPGKVHVLEEEDPQTHKPIQYIEYCNLGEHIAYMRTQVKQDRRLKNGTIKMSSNTLALKLSVPPSFEAFMNKAYPKLFTDELQTDQFLKAFPAFDLRK